MSTNDFSHHGVRGSTDARTRHNENVVDAAASSVTSVGPAFTVDNQENHDNLRHQPPFVQHDIPVFTDSDSSEDASLSSHSISDDDDDINSENESADQDANASVDEIVSGGFDTDWFVLSASELHDLE